MKNKRQSLPDIQREQIGDAAALLTGMKQLAFVSVIPRMILDDGATMRTMMVLRQFPNETYKGTARDS
jgi:hypothetical protein